MTCTLHELRHTYATVLTRGNMSPFVMQAILGHENISTTMRYVHISESDKQAAVSSVLPVSLEEADRSERTA